MLRRLCVFAALLAAQWAHAGEAGQVIFVAGEARVVDRAAVLGLAVQEGELMKTGADGFIYIKTIDNGLFILRPNSLARISTYRVDKVDPAKTQVKLELLSGVARAKSGDAVKAARQNFRFNTPVAAIGVRGTDFTVFTDQNETRVAVVSGGVVVSGFGGACSPDGGGPCEGKASVELSAAQRGKLLQVQRGSVTPILVPAGMLSPDTVSPARQDEPTAKAGGQLGSPLALDLDAQKNTALRNVASQNTAEAPSVAPPAQPPVIISPELTPIEVVTPLPIPVPTPMPEAAPSGIVWGRWQPLANSPAKFNLITQKGKNELVALNGNYALLRTPGTEYVAAEKGIIAFKLQESEVFVTTTSQFSKTVNQAAVLGGKLAVDFGTRTFSTNLDMTSNADKFTMRSDGRVTGDGRMVGNIATGAGVMNMQGMLSNDAGGSAAYIFDGKVDDKRTVNGATYWRK